MKVYQINVEANFGSTGKIAEAIGNTIIAQEGKAFLAHGRQFRKSVLTTKQVGNTFSYAFHLLLSRIFDGQGKGSYFSTKKLIKHIQKVKPDIIHLHNIHGYYLNYEVLFNYLNKIKVPVVWTLHDCWAFTGHCTHFEPHNCEKWKSLCGKCPAQKDYPANYGVDFSTSNFKKKKELFSVVSEMHLVPVSNWLHAYVEQSFLQHLPSTVITNGINLKKFRPVSSKLYENKTVILGVASVWDKNKGFNDFVKLSNYLNTDEVLVMVGLNKKQMAEIPEKIIGIERTSNIDELVELYSRADGFFNLTYADSYPTTIMEAMACGTPVITYETGGCVEMVSDSIGSVIPQGNFKIGLQKFRMLLEKKNKEERVKESREFAESRFDDKKQIEGYLNLYQNVLNRTKISD